MPIGALESVLRMAAAVILGAAIGLERERVGRPAGLRTHLLVSLASATFMLVSTQFMYYQRYLSGDMVSTDPSRIASSVVSGIGFLGAGAIMRIGLNIQGLTTAASLWLVSAVGLAAGGGMYLVAATATVVSLISLTLLRQAEGKQWRLFHRHLTIQANSGEREAIPDLIKDLGGDASFIDYDEDVVEKTVTLSLDVKLADQAMLEKVLLALEARPGITRVRVKQPNVKT